MSADILLPHFAAVPTLAVDDDVYLSQRAVQQALAPVLFPNGVTNGDEWQQLLDACNLLATQQGYGPVVQLTPPAVPFGQDGPYWRKLPTLDARLMQQVIADVGEPLRDSYVPTVYFLRSQVLDVTAQRVHQVERFAQLDKALGAQFADTVDAFFVSNGWSLNAAAQRSDVRGRRNRGRYERQLTPKTAELHQALVAYIRQQNGFIRHDALERVATEHAFGQPYTIPKAVGDDKNDRFVLLRVGIERALAACDYDTVLRRGVYRPKPLTLSPQLQERLTHLIQSHPRLETKHGDVIDCDALREAVCVLLGLGQLGEHDPQWQQLEADVVAPALEQMHFNSQRQWLGGRRFVPARSEGLRVYAAQFQRVDNPEHWISLARHDDDNNLPVLAPICVIDNDARAVICLRMIGESEAVKANWARLMSSYQTPVKLDDIYIRQRGMKQHICIKRKLGLGLVDWLLLHRQASVREMNPAHPCYVLDDRSQPVPVAFMPLLDATISVPTQPQWASYLWQVGVEEGIVQLARRRGHTYLGWRIDNDSQCWGELISNGLREGKIHLNVSAQANLETADAAVMPSADTQLLASSPQRLPLLRSPSPQAETISLPAAASSPQAAAKSLQAATVFPQAVASSPQVAVLTPVKAAAFSLSQETPIMKFPLGKVVMTPGAREMAKSGVNLATYLERHANCDDGDLDAHDKRANKEALRLGLRIFSSYNTLGGKLWIISEADRSVTSLLLPAEY